MYNIILVWARFFLRIYFRRTILYGKGHVPLTGPLIVASNHPSAFMEASVIATVIGRQIHFLVRGDVFNPKFRWLFNWTNQIPIYRQKDGISSLRKNASSFDLTYRKLAEGHAVLIFPEAKTLLEKKLRPVQRGTAHLAFGTIPFLKEDQELLVLPVGVNFTNPRIPGTDVIVQFGEPFVSPRGRREDREAIESFTAKLAEVMDPLVVQIHDGSNELKYDVLVSIYMTGIRASRPASTVLSDCRAIAGLVNESEPHREFLHTVNQHIHLLQKAKIREAIYFPGLLSMNGIGVACMLLLKSFWFIAGGWIWRLSRRLIFSKLRTDTFQGPTSLGAAMVLFLLLSIVGLLLCLLKSIPVWWMLIWWVTLASGKFIPAPIGLMWKVMLTSQPTRKIFRDNIQVFKSAIIKLY
jgi:1-acyl-sn-glycerol-3-phosphate acyltransferase